jgi:hypothetical protein
VTTLTAVNERYEAKIAELGGLLAKPDNHIRAIEHVAQFFDMPVKRVAEMLIEYDRARLRG